MCLCHVVWVCVCVWESKRERERVWVLLLCWWRCRECVYLCLLANTSNDRHEDELITFTFRALCASYDARIAGSIFILNDCRYFASSPDHFVALVHRRVLTECVWKLHNSHADHYHIGLEWSAGRYAYSHCCCFLSLPHGVYIFLFFVCWPFFSMSCLLVRELDGVDHVHKHTLRIHIRGRRRRAIKGCHQCHNHEFRMEYCGLNLNTRMLTYIIANAPALPRCLSTGHPKSSHSRTIKIEFCKKKKKIDCRGINNIYVLYSGCSLSFLAL